MPASIRYLGIDPGLRAMGWGVIEVTGTRLRHIANGTITSSAKRSLAERLVELEAGLVAVIEAHAPDSAAVENAFVARDAAAALKLGQARAIALLVPSRAGLVVAEYAPNHVKKAVVGAGHAGKGQIQMMVEMLLPGCRAMSEHAADALAIAICHAHAGAGETRVADALLREANR
ncbi:MAG: crossover junction endodeoxyribonuclease RuvC [Rhizobiales bacterium]|nr:crossover junction endodeoxyribonuclease RuvC [Hyphomicrobiales bacterium]